MLIEYSSNNSGGDWWLEDEDWHNLEEAGWKVKWVKDSGPDYWLDDNSKDRWLGALAKEATKEFESIHAAKLEFWSITGQDPDEEGCSCCGPPHNFYHYE